LDVFVDVEVDVDVIGASWCPTKAMEWGMLVVVSAGAGVEDGDKQEEEAVDIVGEGKEEDEE
jgi:hypothetical protein